MCQINRVLDQDSTDKVLGVRQLDEERKIEYPDWKNKRNFFPPSFHLIYEG